MKKEQLQKELDVKYTDEYNGGIKESCLTTLDNNKWEYRAYFNNGCRMWIEIENK